MSVFKELKRRKVFKAGAAYIVVGLGVLGAAELILDPLGLGAARSFIVVFVVLGFPIALVLAWAYDMTPQGLKLDRDIDRSAPITPQTLKRLKGAKTAGTRLRFAIYKSRCSELANWEMLESILESSTKNNPLNAITGVLVATETHFLQVLEGEFETLNATYEKISHDKRHYEIQLISFGEINKRRFGDWSMHGIGLFDLNSELAAMLCSKFGGDNGNVLFPSTEQEVMSLLKMVLPEEQLVQT